MHVFRKLRGDFLITPVVTEIRTARRTGSQHTPREREELGTIRDLAGLNWKDPTFISKEYRVSKTSPLLCF